MNRYLVHIKVLQNDGNSLIALIDKGVDLNLLDPLGNSPMHLAVLCRNILLVKTLLSAGANPKVISNEFLTPAEKAASLGYHDIAELITSFSDYCILPSLFGPVENNYLN